MAWVGRSPIIWTILALPCSAACSGPPKTSCMSSLKACKVVTCVACVVVVVLCGCRQQNSAIYRSEKYARQANAYQAYLEIAEARKKNSGDRELERLYWQRRLEFLLDRGRQMVFLEQEVDAIAELEKALALDPQNQMARLWILKAKEKLAKRAVRHGDDQRSQGHLETALLHFREALSYVPEYPPALEGIEKVNKYYADRYDQAADHLTKGSRARGEDLTKQSKYHHGIAHDKDPSLQIAKKRELEAAQRLARDRYERARIMEEQADYGAALMEYEAVIKVVPGIEGLEVRIAAMKREVEARNLRREAGIAMRKDKFDEAEKLLNQAYEKSVAQRADISGLLLDNRRRRHQSLYRKAMDLELEYKFEAALESYRVVDKAWPAGFEDVKARISTLERSIEVAQKCLVEGEKHEKAGDLKKAVQSYEDALDNYPGYKGLDKRVKELRAKIQN